MAEANKNGSTLEYLNVCISLLNLAIVAVGGYILVGRYEARLAETQAAINEVELNFMELQASLNIKASTLLSAIQINDIISSSKPKLNFQIDPNVEILGEHIEVKFRSINSGSHAITVVAEKIYLLRSLPEHGEMPNDSSIIQMIEPGFQNWINPGGELTFGFSFDIPKQSSFFYLAIFSADTDRDIYVNVARNLKTVGVEFDEGIFSTMQIRYGQINL